MRKGTSSESLCIHCNKCMPTIYRGTRCVLVSGPGASTVSGPGASTVSGH
jgi:hypothetical protein